MSQVGVHDRDTKGIGAVRLLYTRYHVRVTLVHRRRIDSTRIAYFDVFYPFNNTVCKVSALGYYSTRATLALS